MGLTSALFSTPAMDTAFGDTARLQAMLDVEAALARAQASVGVVPATAAAPIARACRAGRYDAAALAEAAAGAGNLAIPLVAALTREVARDDAEAARWVHWGATSQDVIDTGLVLQVGRALPLLEADAARLAAALAGLARAHRGSVMAGRTWLQHAAPTTFGLKAAGWLDGLRRARARLREAGEAMRVLQFGGAVGTLASLGAQGPAVARALAAELGLAYPPIPWHAQRERVADLGCALALLCGSLGKLARDLSLLAQAEVGEVAEPAAPGRGGSSTMPHKRNPVACAVALQAAARAPGLAATLLSALPQEHERGLGGWHAEWETLPELFRLAAGALAQMASAVEGLEVDAPRMRANLDATGGLLMAEAVSMALAERVGRAEAHARVEAASRRALDTRTPFRGALLADPAVTEALGPGRIDALLDPAARLGAADAFIDAVLREHEAHG